MKKLKITALDIAFIVAMSCVLTAAGSLVWAIVTGQVDVNNW